jgi:uncharacterized protein
MIDNSLKIKIEIFLLPYEEAFSIDELCGFLYGIAITPEMIPPSEWFPMVFSGEMPEFESKTEIEEVMKHLMDAYNQFIQKFNDSTLKFPYDYQELEPPEFVRVEEWCMGLSLGMQLRGDLWVPNDEPEDMDEMQNEIMSCVAIVRSCADPDDVGKFFNHKYSTDPKVREEGIEGDELMAMLFGSLPMAVDSLTKIGAQMAAYNDEVMTPPQTVRSTKKIGRNEPCPCGSGKKFKKCCLGIDDGGGFGQTIH